MKHIFFSFGFLLVGGLLFSATPIEVAANGVLQRVLGEDARFFNLIEDPSLVNFLSEGGEDFPTDTYTVDCNGDTVTVKGNSVVALTRGAYDYLRNATLSIVSWSGTEIRLPQPLPKYQVRVESPYPYRYYFNVVTHGYSTPFWDWNRWEKEFDWMAVHGVNMPLMGGAHEAILYRVWQKLGLTQEEALAYFTGPAHFPWNRMGNITQWDGPLPLSYFDKQVELTHKQLDRMKELGMEPIIHAFAGFVPSGITRLYPDVKLLDLAWGGFDSAYKAQILTPDNPLFIEIGKMYIEEWEREFGKGKYYLADSFNEMDVPVSGSMAEQKAQLADFGYSVYQAIGEANPDAVWVMQGWTFPFHQQDGALFWTPQRLEALLSKVPDDKLVILDLANEYNLLLWDLEPSWKKYSGFFGKQWVYSFIPNMGGKVDFTGVLDLYATAPIEALNYEKRGKQIGFGVAPEGIENNEVVYELILDMGWQWEPIDVDSWLDNYYACRYGELTPTLKEAIDLLHTSAYNSFTDHPRRSFQFKRKAMNVASAHRSPEFLQAIELFLSCSEEYKDQPLYRADALELAAFYLGCYAEDSLKRLSYKVGRSKYRELTKLQTTLMRMDQLLNTHPTLRLELWVDFARGWGDSESEKDYYESNAKRLITTWGGDIDEYSARLWSGLIRDYYLPRITFELTEKPSKETLLWWEENWLQFPGISNPFPVEDPLKNIPLWIKEAPARGNKR